MRQRRAVSEEIASNVAAQIAPVPERRESSISEKVRRLRLWRRRQVSVVARAVIGSQSLPLTIGDVSQTGLGFRGQTGLAVDMAVEIHLSDGRVLGGTVVWTRNGRGGIELAEALCIDDPVFGTLLGGAVSARQGAQYGIGGVWQRVSSLLAGQGGVEELSIRSIERACRKQGYSWLADEARGADLDGVASAGLETELTSKFRRPK